MPSAIRGLLMLALLLAAARARAGEGDRTRVEFVDRCSRQPVAMITPRGAELVVSIRDLRPGAPAVVEATLAPSGIPEGLDADFSIRLVRRSPPADASGQVELRLRPDLGSERISERFLDRVWNVRVLWIQAGEGGGARPALRSGGAGGGVYVARELPERFFRVTGPLVCLWETPVAIASGYYLNRSQVPMAVSRSRSGVDLFTGQRGFGLPVGFGSSAGGGSFGGIVFWHVPGATRSDSQQSATFGQTWILAPGEGGFVGRRLSFARMPAEEFVAERRGECPEIRKGRAGFLDVGRELAELGVVPESLSGDPARSAEFLEKLRPAIRGCSPTTGPMGGDAHRVRGAPGELLFFYAQPQGGNG